MSALFCLFLCFTSYSEKLEEYIPTFYMIRYILEELFFVLENIKKTPQKVAYLWQLGVCLFFSDIPKQPRTSFYAAETIQIP